MCDNIIFCENIDLSRFSTLTPKIQNFSLEMVPEDILPVLTYISGYTVRKELRLGQCSECVEWLQLKGKIVEVDMEFIPYDLIMELDRGKLTLPSEISITATSACWYIIQNIFDDFFEDFLHTKSQVSVLLSFSLIFIKQYCESLDIYAFSVSESATCSCNKTLFDKLKSISFTACKILINNFVKNINNNNQPSSSGKRNFLETNINKQNETGQTPIQRK